MSTSYFGNCVGVFQGGGVRGAAFAGAYEAARKAGVAFSAVAGTSAGALAASLIATGAPPSLITQKLMDADLNRFLTDVDRRQALVGSINPWRLGRLVTGGLWRKISTIAVYGGLHSSTEIYRWVDETLQQLLKSQGRAIDDAQVKFRHLPIPLSIVAADLTNNTYVIFSRERTPDSSVAAAVRASCTIPFFYQPVLEGGSAYVDGGVLSNLPAFIFNPLGDGDFGKYSPRVLAFRLVSKPTRREITSLPQLGEALADTIVGGATDIQQLLQPGHHSIIIDTGSIKATDFNAVGKKQKQALYNAGKTATERFIRNERNFFAGRRSPTTFVGRDQQMLLIVQALGEAREDFIILDNSSPWLYLTFPAFLAAARRGVRIRYLTTQQGGLDPMRQRHEAYRQRLLAGLGAHISECDQLPFRGFLVDPDLETAFAALTHSQSETTSYEVVFQSEETRTYSRHMDPEVLHALVRDANIPPWNTAPAGAPNLEFQPCDEVLLFERLRTVPHYHAAEFAMRDVALDSNIQATQIHVKEFKYLQIDALTRDFLGCDLQPFMPQQIVLRGGMTTIVTPPVLEEDGSYLTLIEGHTRALHCLRNGKPTVRAVVVTGVTAPLPVRTRLLSDLTIESKTLARELQYDILSRENWRDIEEHVHPVGDGEKHGTEHLPR